MAKHKYPRLPVNRKNLLTISLCLSPRMVFGITKGQWLDVRPMHKYQTSAKANPNNNFFFSCLGITYLDVVFTCSII